MRHGSKPWTLAAMLMSSMSKFSIEKLLKIVNVFQIGSCLIGCFFILRSFLSFFSQSTPSVAVYVFTILLLALAFAIVYTNILLFFEKEKSKKLLSFNRWVNFAQIFYFSLFGFVYYLTIGLVVRPFFLYTDGMKFGIDTDSFNIRSTLYFTSGVTDIGIGINLVPLILFLFFEAYLNKMGTKTPHVDAQKGFET